MLEASRIMNLYQFIQLYKDITSQAAEVLTADGSMECSSGQLSSAASCQASMWMGRYSFIKKKTFLMILPGHDFINIAYMYSFTPVL